MNIYLKLLSKLVSINSIYPNENKLSVWIEDFFTKQGFKPQREKVEKNRANLLIEKGRGDFSVLLYAHIDTVALVDGWKSNPFKLRVEREKAYGLGAWDMKSGLVINLLTFLNYMPKNYKLKLAFCVDEENISKGAYKLIHTSFLKDVKCIISTEPSFSPYGVAGIVTGRVGRAVYSVKIKGAPKHVAFFDRQFDTNYVTAQFINSIQVFNKNLAKNKRQFMFVKKIQSESSGISTPAETILEVDSYILPPNTHSLVLERLAKIAVHLEERFTHFNISVELKKRETPYLESYEISQKNTYLSILKKPIQETLQRRAVPYFRMSVADENVFGSSGYTVLGIGPEGGNAHAPNEWVSLTSLEKLYNIIGDFLKKVDKHYDLG